jgi:hypothetical protein
MSPEYQPYNCAVGGYGPQHMLAKLQSASLKQEVKESSGALVYVFQDDHVNRAIGSMFVYNLWGSRMPFYTFDRDGQLVYKGNFTSGRPGLSRLYRFLGKSEIAKYFHVNLPAEINDEHLRLTARIVEESARTFKRQFGSDAFYVLFYPGSGYSASLIPYLKKAGVKYLDYSKLLDMKASGYAIPGDGHPTAKAHQRVAAQLAQDVNP